MAVSWEISAAGYTARLEDGELVHRNPRGRALKKAPSVLAGHPGMSRLLSLRDGVQAHRRACQAEVERMVREAVPLDEVLLAVLSADSAWRAALAAAGPPPAGGPDRAATVKGSTLVARSYVHPALPPGEVRVLLTGTDAGRHRDRLMAHQGWELTGTADTALPDPGPMPFPEAALAEHPGQAEAVLHFVERFERETAGWQRYLKHDLDAVFRELAKAEPALLRCFLDGLADRCLEHRENATAVAYFARARDAARSRTERCDQDRLADRYAAFDAAGTLTDTALRARIREVTAKGAEPEPARRTLVLLADRAERDGVDPRLAQDIRRTARAAGLDPELELAEVVHRLLPARSLYFTSAVPFWREVMAAPLWDRIRAERPGLAHEVLAVLPHGVLNSPAGLEYLERTGALELLTAPAGPAGLPAGAPAEWFQRAVEADRGYRPAQRLLELAELLGPRLAADAVPITLPYQGRGDRDPVGIRLGLADVLLAADVPVNDPPPLLGDPYPHSIHVGPRTELRAVTADPRFDREIRALLRAEFELTNGGAADNAWYQPHSPKGWTTPHVLLGTATGRRVLAEWCDEELDRLPSLDLDGLGLLLGRFMHIGAATGLLADRRRADLLAAVDPAALLLAAAGAAAPGTPLDRPGAELLLRSLESDWIPKEGVGPHLRGRIGKLLDQGPVGGEFGRLVQLAANCRDGLAHVTALLGAGRDTGTGADGNDGDDGTPSGSAPTGSTPAGFGPDGPGRVRIGLQLRAALDGPLWGGDLDRPSAVLRDARASFGSVRRDLYAAVLRGDAKAAALVAEYAEYPFVTEQGTGRWRTVRTSPPHGRYRIPHGHLFRGADSVAVVIGDSWGQDSVLLEYTPSGAFPPGGPLRAAGATLQEESLLEPVLERRWCLAYAEQQATRGPLPSRPDLPRELARRLALTPAQAEALLAVQSPHHVRPPGEEELRQAFGHGIAADFQEQLIPEQPERLWTHGPDLERAIRWWQERHGALPVPDELLAQAQGDFRLPKGQWSPHHPAPAVDALPDGVRRRPQQVLAMLATALAAPGTPDWAPPPYACARTVAWLAYRTPAGHPLRPAIGAAAARMTADPARPWRVFSVDRKAAAGRPPSPLPLAGLAGVRVVDDEDLGRWHVLVRPDALNGPDDPALHALEEYFDTLLPSHWQPAGSGLPAPADLRLLLSGGLTELAAHLAQDSARTPGWEQDPRRSVPELVAECAEACALPADAAALHLMLLALPDPTDRRVKQWTGWSTAQLRKAGESLEAGGLAVRATRARAGRQLFVPGAWTELKAPRLPLETSKLALLPYAAERAFAAHTALVPALPLPALFTEAWRKKGREH
ncbi:hypothetical protein ACFC1R_21335 [Kitasatospora sp. NPDC056138]|uniref:hypothetical protein n=1 Tax=Kitasatospora sp. NPDC056138 TaxID=3345724 RepID=UPI0035D8C5DA